MADDRAAMPSFSSGQSVFVPDEEQCYALAKVSAVQGATVTATKKNGESVSTKDAVHFDPYDEEQGDLVQMTHVDAANMLNTLRARHKAGHAYTNAGQRGIVISVNPYKWIDICARSSLPPRCAHSIGIQPSREVAEKFVGPLSLSARSLLGLQRLRGGAPLGSARDHPLCRPAHTTLRPFLRHYP